MITSNYESFKDDLSYRKVSISGDRGAKAKFDGECFPKLAPKLSFWKIWHNNIGTISEEENNKYYIEEYYKQVLSKLDPEEIFKDLYYAVLLCYEDKEFCHRHIVAAWFELLLEVDVKEGRFEGPIIIGIERQNYDFIKNTLENVIKENENMRGFNSVRAWYLFNRGEKLEAKAKELEEKTNKPQDDLRQAACFLRCDADEAEYQYNNRISKNKKTKSKSKN